MVASQCLKASFATAVLLAFILGFKPHLLAQSSPDDRTLEVLCQRGLAPIAIGYTTRRLETATDESSRAKWTMRLMECISQAALNADPKASQTLWLRSHNLLEEYTRQIPNSPRLPWLAWQDLRGDLLQTQAQLARYLAAPANAKLRESALQSIRDLLRKSEAVEEDIRKRLPLAARQTARDATQATAEELNQLSIDIALLKCETMRVRATLYPPGSPDRTAAATEVKTLASEALLRTADGWPAREQLQVALATAALELGESAEGLLALEKLAKTSNLRLVRVRAATTVIETLVRGGQLSRLRPMLDVLASADAGPEFALANLQIALAETADLAEEPKKAALNALVQRAKEIEAEFGDYWRNRAEALLLGTNSSDSSKNEGLSLDLVLVEVRQLLAAENTSAAVAKLLQYRDIEAAADHGETAVQVAAQAAALLQNEMKWAESIAAVENIVDRFSDVPPASSTHALIVWARTQLLRQDPTNEEARLAYESALLHQISNWPDSGASEQASEWLKNWWLAQGRKGDYLSALRSRMMNAKEPLVVNQVSLLWLEILLTLSNSSAANAELADFSQQLATKQSPEISHQLEIVQHFARVFTLEPTNQALKEWSSSQRQLTQKIPNPSEVQRALLDACELAIQLQSTANQGTALAEIPHWNSSALSTEFKVALSSCWIAMIDELSLPAQRKAAESLNIDSPWMAGLRESEYDLLAAYGERFEVWLNNASQGLEDLSRRAQAQPRNGPLQLQLANALASSGSNRIAESNTIARRLAASSTPGSDLNLQARWRLLKNLVFAEQTAEARQSAKLLLATQPIESALWKERFERIANP